MVQSDQRYLPVSASAPRAQGACDDAHRETARGSAGTDGRRRPSMGGTTGAGTTFEAHMSGQANPRRGLKGGAATLRAARTAYLTTQWTGADDRRPPSGLLRKVSV